MRALERRGEPELLIDEVAAEAGVTKPVLYRYFADKAELISALGERATETLFERLVPAITTDGPPMTRIREAVGAYFAVIDESPNLHRLLIRYSGTEPLLRIMLEGPDRDLIQQWGDEIVSVVRECLA